MAGATGSWWAQAPNIKAVASGAPPTRNRAIERFMAAAPPACNDASERSRRHATCRDLVRGRSHRRAGAVACVVDQARGGRRDAAEQAGGRGGYSAAGGDDARGYAGPLGAPVSAGMGVGIAAGAGGRV